MIFRRLVSRARRCRLLSRVLFRINFIPLKKEDYYFDVTTPVLIARALKDLAEDSRVLDMGTGASCVIGLSIWKRLGCHVISSDVDPDVLALARKNIDFNEAPIRLINSCFFENIDERFDTVVFNPPYVPTEVGVSRRLSQERRTQWDGGAAGSKVIKDFLEAFTKLDHPAAAVMGVNFRHVPRKTITNLLSAKKDISVKEIYRHPLLPVDVYTFRRK